MKDLKQTIVRGLGLLFVAGVVACVAIVLTTSAAMVAWLLSSP